MSRIRTVKSLNTLNKMVTKAKMRSMWTDWISKSSDRSKIMEQLVWSRLANLSARRKWFEPFSSRRIPRLLVGFFRTIR